MPVYPPHNFEGTNCFLLCISNALHSPIFFFLLFIRQTFLVLNISNELGKVLGKYQGVWLLDLRLRFVKVAVLFCIPTVNE